MTVCNFQGWVIKGTATFTLVSWSNILWRKALPSHEDSSSLLERPMWRGIEAPNQQPAPGCQPFKCDLESRSSSRTQAFWWLEPHMTIESNLLRDLLLSICYRTFWWIFHFSYCTFQLQDSFMCGSFIISLMIFSIWWDILLMVSIFVHGFLSSLSTYKIVDLKSCLSNVWASSGAISINFPLYIGHTFLFLSRLVISVENWTFWIL